jgi:hypothetical protein
MDQLPAYLWAITIAGVAAVAAAMCVLLYNGAVTGTGTGTGTAGTAADGSTVQRRYRAMLLAGGAAVLLGGWLTASALIASHGWYHTKLGHQVPWMPVAAGGFLVTLLLLGRLPVVKRALTAPGTDVRLLGPHSFRVAAVVFLIAMALGHLPALFALPAGLGDIATGISAPFVARKLAHGDGHRAAVWFNLFGLLDLVVALTLGALTAYQLVHVSPSNAAISELPLALITTVDVPMLLALHITSLSVLARVPRTAKIRVGAMNYSA